MYSFKFHAPLAYRTCPAFLLQILTLLDIPIFFHSFKTLHEHCVRCGIPNLPPMPDKGGPEMFIKGRTDAHIMVRKAAFQKILECICKASDVARRDELVGEFFGVWTMDMPGRNQYSRFNARQRDREGRGNQRQASRAVRRTGPGATLFRALNKAKRAAGM